MVLKDQIKEMKKINKLIINKSKTGGRNNQGRITAYHRGGGNKALSRVVDHRRSLFNIPGLVKKIEYDPNRTANLALIAYKNGILSYILAPGLLRPGAIICAGTCVDLNIGNAMPIGKMPIGTMVHNVELKPGHGGQIIRAAGTYAKLIRKNKEEAVIRLHSGLLYTLSAFCMATIGGVSNEVHKNINFEKAGASRWRGRRPLVRGAAMNPVDHPHGGGEGRSKGGRHPVTPWGKLTKGKATSFKRITTIKKNNYEKD